MKIIYFEGLFGNIFKWLWHGQIKHLALKYPDLTIERHHWLSKRPIDDPDVIVIGHSFGAAAALKNTLRCNTIFLFDCRNGFLTNYETNNEKIACYNYHQSKPLKGYHVFGADNFFVKGSSHLKIVTNYEAHKGIVKAIEEAK